MLQDKYEPKRVEEGKYQEWLDHHYFECGDMSKKPYCIVIPPPNVTGKLHLGHAMDNTIQDLLSRYNRLKGKDVLWVPGMDHAGIATQAKVDARLKEQGVSRYDIGREKFLDKAWEWKKEYSDFIRSQWAKLGNSTDYRKERFTLDEGLSKAVAQVFVTYYKEGLIYQGARVINWDPQAKTALSNIEVIHKDVEAFMYYLKYQLVGSDESFTVATTRPETMFGDVCIVVNPKDEKVNYLIGKSAINPANGKELPIIGDEYIEIGFGTGIMKCTPAHDPNDYQIAIRHNLPMPICMHEDGRMNELCGEFDGLDRFDCREKLLEKFKKDGSFVKAEKITHSVGHSERTGVMIEPYLSKQWFVKMKPLADDVLKAQENPDTKINFYPKRFEKTFNQWLENIEDWCISRQLWWGHRIPVWYHKETGEIYCEVEPPKDIENWTQDEDVLDTWFSSALWPFSTLGWPDTESVDLKRYFPTTCMVTGYDIIFFWVARMAFSARHFMNDVPFKDCLIHGLIRDEKGRKMSKSLGNGIDPIDLINQYGCDALRLFLSTNSTPGLDMNYSTEKMEAGWNFINKLWNASRYVLMNCDDSYKYKEPSITSDIDCWIVNKLNETIQSATTNLDKYELAIAGNDIMSFVWDDFCSMYIEFTKSALNSDNIEAKHATLDTLIYVLQSILKLLHPFIPFVTEEIYQEINGKEKSICIEAWPEIKQINIDLAKDIDKVIEIIKATREIRTENNIKPSLELHVLLDGFKLNDSLTSIIYRMCKLNVIDSTDAETIVRPTTFGKVIYIMDEIVDKKAELEKIEKELIRLQSEIARSNGMLSNEKFISKAPKEKVDEEKQKLINYQNSYDTLLQKKKEFE